MKIVEGTLDMIGSGTWDDGGGGGKTVVSALDIGNHHLRKILIPDYIRNYMTPGEHVRVLISNGLSQGLITRPFIAAVEADGKKHKIGMGTLGFMAVAKSLLYSLPIGGLLGAMWPPLYFVGLGAVGFFYWREIQAVMTF